MKRNTILHKLLYLTAIFIILKVFVVSPLLTFFK
jgi:hypothetical protein